MSDQSREGLALAVRAVLAPAGSDTSALAGAQALADAHGVKLLKSKAVVVGHRLTGQRVARIRSLSARTHDDAPGSVAWVVSGLGALPLDLITSATGEAAVDLFVGPSGVLRVEADNKDAASGVLVTVVVQGHTWIPS